MPVIKKKANSVVYQNEKTGKTTTLLNQQGKIGKFSAELKSKERYTNDGKPKLDKDGNPTKLTDSQAAYRAGYIEACKDSSKIFKKKNADYERKTKTIKHQKRYGFPPKNKRGEE